jgi:hypothetical protein
VSARRPTRHQPTSRHRYLHHLHRHARLTPSDAHHQPTDARPGEQPMTDTQTEATRC